MLICISFVQLKLDNQVIKIKINTKLNHYTSIQNMPQTEQFLGNILAVQSLHRYNSTYKRSGFNVMLLINEINLKKSNICH